MNRFKYILFLLTLAMSFSFVSCTSEEDQKLFTGQEKLIEDFIKNQTGQHPEFTVTSNDGVERLTVKKGEGESLSKNGSIEFYYAGYVLSRNGTSNDQLFNTNHKGLAEEIGWKTDNENAFDIVQVSLKKDKLIKGLEKGLVGVQAGEECFIFFTTENAFGEKKMNGMPINSGLIYHIWVEKVTN